MAEAVKIDRLPENAPGVTDAEADALREVIPLASDLALHGDERAGSGG